MLTTERRAWLLARLTRDGRLVASDVAAELATSEDTIRRDPRELASDGRLQRVHGGALPVSPALAPFVARQSIATDAKDAVARHAASLVRPGQTVIVDGGTTALRLAEALDPDLAATVVTHSPTIAVALADHPRVDVLVIGGRLFKHSVVTCGALAAEAAAGIHADACFLGVTGVHPDAGLTTGDADEAAMKRTLAHRAADTYVLASSEKVGAVSPHRVLDLADVTSVITDDGADRRTLDALRAAGIDVRVAAGRPRRR
ncbi:MAG TPA: DeoR/GlpR family DNA-binding transcription regulator [Ilumatobacteraceae bacterium]|nr:DeoR/GlpR family DNA-binding transcription regulator [Ilumatobacteraceae bacterium]